MANLRERTISGFMWTLFSQGGKVLSLFITTAILARLLSPDDFGLVALAIVFTEFINIFCNAGIANSIIRKQKIEEDYLNTAFWLSLGIGFVIFFLIQLLAIHIAHFYDKPSLAIILKTLSYGFPIYSSSFVHQAILTKEMKFKILSIRQISAIMVSCSIGIGMALLGYGVWSLLFQSLTNIVMGAILFWIISDWRPRFAFSFKSLKEIFSFSMATSGSSLLVFFSRNYDKLIIGKILGTSSLGFYSIAYKIMMYPLYHIGWIIQKVTFPAFSSLKGDVVRTRSAYLRTVKATALITLPAMMVLMTLSEEFVLFVYGEKWIFVAKLIQILGFAGIIQSIVTLSLPIFLTFNRVYLKLILDIVNLVGSVFSIMIGIRWGLIGVALAYTCFITMWSMLLLYHSNKIIEISFSQIFRTLFLPIFISGILVAIVLVIKFFWLDGMKLFLPTVCIICLIVYISILFMKKIINIKNKSLIINI